MTPKAPALSRSMRLSSMTSGSWWHMDSDITQIRNCNARPRSTVGKLPRRAKPGCRQDAHGPVCRLRTGETAQEGQLLLAEPRRVGDRLGAGQHGEQAEQLDLVEPIEHLARWRASGRCFERRQENDSLPKRTPSRTVSLRGRVLQRIRGSQQIQHFTPLSRTASPDCRDLDPTPIRPCASTIRQRPSRF